MKKKKTTLTSKEKQILKDLEGSIKWVKLHEQGKVKSKTIQEFLDQL